MTVNALTADPLFQFKIPCLIGYLNGVAGTQIVQPYGAFFVCRNSKKVRCGSVVTGHLGDVFFGEFIAVGFEINHVNRLLIFKDQVDGSIDENFIFIGVEQAAEREFAFPVFRFPGDDSQRRTGETPGKLGAQ